MKTTVKEIWFFHKLHAVCICYLYNRNVIRECGIQEGRTSYFPMHDFRLLPQSRKELCSSGVFITQPVVVISY